MRAVGRHHWMLKGDLQWRRVHDDKRYDRVPSRLHLSRLLQSFHFVPLSGRRRDHGKHDAAECVGNERPTYQHAGNRLGWWRAKRDDSTAIIHRNGHTYRERPIARHRRYRRF